MTKPVRKINWNKIKCFLFGHIWSPTYIEIRECGDNHVGSRSNLASHIEGVDDKYENLYYEGENWTEKYEIKNCFRCKKINETYIQVR